MAAKAGQRYAVISSLTPEHRAALDSYLVADHPIDKLVKIVKEDWGELPDSSPEAVRRMLYRYKAREIKTKQAKLAAQFTSDRSLQDLAAKIVQLEDRLDPVLLLEELVTTQKGRVEKMVTLEKSSPTLLEVQTKNIGMLGDLLVKLINAQLEVGVLTRVPKKLKVDAVNVTDEERAFIERARLSDTQAGFLVDSMKLLRDIGVIDVTPQAGEDSGG